MTMKTAIVAVLCSAILSVGLAVGLGAGGNAAAASDPSLKQLKGIRAELVDVNEALGDPAFLGPATVVDILQAICDNTSTSSVGCN